MVRRSRGAAPTATDSEEVAERLHAATIQLLRRIRSADKKTGVSPARLSALTALVLEGSMPLGQLADVEQVKPPTMTNIVRGLQHDGLVGRSADKTDRRVHHVRATAKGRSLLNKGRRARIAALVHILDDLDPDEVTLLADAAELMERVLRGAS